MKMNNMVKGLADNDVVLATCTLRKSWTGKIETITIVEGTKSIVKKSYRIYGIKTTIGEQLMNALEYARYDFSFLGGNFSLIKKMIVSPKSKPQIATYHPTIPQKVVGSYIEYPVPDNQQCKWDHCFDKAEYDGYCLHHFRQNQQM